MRSSQAFSQTQTPKNAVFDHGSLKPKYKHMESHFKQNRIHDFEYLTSHYQEGASNSRMLEILSMCYEALEQ